MKYVADKDGHWIPVERDTSARLHVQDDIKDFRSADGKHISGRKQWREHLKRTGAIEMGHSDIAASTEKWNKRKADWAEKMAKVPSDVVRDAPVMDAPDYQRTRLNAEVLNRLEGRPVPSRAELIKITLEQARDLSRRR